MNKERLPSEVMALIKRYYPDVPPWKRLEYAKTVVSLCEGEAVLTQPPREYEGIRGDIQEAVTGWDECAWRQKELADPLFDFYHTTQIKLMAAQARAMADIADKLWELDSHYASLLRKK